MFSTTPSRRGKLGFEIRSLQWHALTLESGDHDARDAFDAALVGGHAQVTVVTKMNSFIALAQDPTKGDPDTSVRKLVREAYTDDKSRHAILKDGEHLGGGALRARGRAGGGEGRTHAGDVVEKTMRSLRSRAGFIAGRPWRAIS